MQNLGDTHICVIGTTKNDVLLFDNNSAVVSVETPPTESELQMEQAQDTYCNTVTLRVGFQWLEISLDHRENLIRKSISDEATQVVVLEPLWKRILYMAHHPPVSGHAGQRRMYKKLQQTYSWAQVASAVFVTVA